MKQDETDKKVWASFSVIQVFWGMILDPKLANATAKSTHRAAKDHRARRHRDSRGRTSPCPSPASRKWVPHVQLRQLRTSRPLPSIWDRGVPLPTTVTPVQCTSKAKQVASCPYVMHEWQLCHLKGCKGLWCWHTLSFTSDFSVH